MTSHWRIWTFLGVVLTAVVVVGVLLPQTMPPTNANDPATAAALNPLENIGVIDTDALVQKHKDARRLDDIDRQIVYLSGELEAGPNPAQYGAAVQKQIEEMQRKLTRQFKGEVDRVQAQLEGRKSAVEGQLKVEADRLQSEMEVYKEQIRREHPELFQQRAPAIGTRDKEQMQNILLARDVNIARRKVELQRQMDERLAVEKRGLDDELAAKMEGVMKANQSAKIQIRLDMETATDEEQRRKLADQMNALTEQEDAKRAELRKEMGNRYEVVRQKELNVAAAELRKYQEKLDGEVRDQLRRIQIGGGGTPENVAEVKRLLEAKQTQLKAKFEARKDALMAELKRESDSAQAFLKSRQSELEQKLRAETKRIVAEVVKSNEAWQKEEQKRRARLEKELTELKEQRERTYDAIVDQIRADVDEVARENNVPLVLGGYRVNIDCKDLTPMVLDRLAKK